jgi:hypothetical protein
MVKVFACDASLIHIDQRAEKKTCFVVYLAMVYVSNGVDLRCFDNIPVPIICVIYAFDFYLVVRVK